MKKTKFILTILCILTLTIASCLTVCAEEEYTYYISFTQGNFSYEYTVISSYDNLAFVKSSDGLNYYFSCYDGVDVIYASTSNGGLISVTYNKVYLPTDDESSGIKTLIGIYIPDLKTDIAGALVFETEAEYIAYAQSLAEEPTTEESTEEPTTEEPTTEPSTEEPTTEPTTEEPTTEPSTEEPEEPTTQEPTTPTQPDADNTDTGLASDFITKLIGTEETFTPQNVMAIFVICLILECISHIASSLLNMSGGLK